MGKNEDGVELGGGRIYSWEINMFLLLQNDTALLFGAFIS